MSTSSEDVRAELRPSEFGPPGVIAPSPLDTTEGSGLPSVHEPRARSQWELITRRFLRHRLAVISLLVLVVLYVVTSLPHLFAPYALNPRNLQLLAANHGPSGTHWLGTDELGRDQTTRIMYAAHVSMTIGLMVAIVSTVLGTLVVAYAILLESALSFLGFGVRPPAVSLGSMLNQSESAVGTPQAYLIYYPGLVLLFIVLCVNFLGDGLRDALDPQSVRH